MENHLKRAKDLANLLDNQFKVGGIKFGIDPILGLFPGIGDFISMMLSSYIVWIGYQMKVPAKALFIMIKNVAVDSLISTIPLVGDLGDIVYKANTKNLKILQKYANEVEEGEIIT